MRVFRFSGPCLCSCWLCRLQLWFARLFYVNIVRFVKREGKRHQMSWQKAARLSARKRSTDAKKEYSIYSKSSTVKSWSQMRASNSDSLYSSLPRYSQWHRWWQHLAWAGQTTLVFIIMMSLCTGASQATAIHMWRRSTMIISTGLMTGSKSKLSLDSNKYQSASRINLQSYFGLTRLKKRSSWTTALTWQRQRTNYSSAIFATNSWSRKSSSTRSRSSVGFSILSCIWTILFNHSRSRIAISSMPICYDGRRQIKMALRCKIR